MNVKALPKRIAAHAARRISTAKSVLHKAVGTPAEFIGHYVIEITVVVSVEVFKHLL